MGVRRVRVAALGAAAWVWCGGSGGGGGGCASVDPSKDVDRAAMMAAQRTGGAPAQEGAAQSGEPGAASEADEPRTHDADGVGAWGLPWQEVSPERELADGLTERGAVRLALRANAGLRAMVEEIGAARADVAQAGLLPNPVVSVAVGFPLRDSPGTSVGASLVQQLAALWTRDARVEGAGAQLDAAVIGVSAEAVRIASDARRSWRRAVWLGREAGVLEERAQALRERAGYITRAREAGEASEIDELMASAEAGMAREVALEVARDAKAAREELAMVIGLGGEGARVQLAGESGWVSADSGWVGAGDSPGEAAGVAVCVERALAWRLDVALAEARARAAAAEARLAGLEGVPEIEAGPMWERDFDGIENLGFELGVEVPVFDDGSAGRARAAARLRAAVLRAIETRQRVRGETARAWTIAESARVRAQVFQAEVEGNLRRAADAVERAVQAGEVGAGDAARVRAEWAGAAARLAKMRREEAEAFVDLDAAIGGWDTRATAGN